MPIFTTNKPHFMDNLENVETDAPDTGIPSTEEVTDTVPEEEKDLSDEELKEEIARLDEEIKNEEDAKEKRHKEQDKGWKQKIIKERDKAKSLEEENRKTKESYNGLEKALIDEAYAKTVDDNFGLPYFENLAKSNPDLANKLAKQYWSKSAKELILDTKRNLADSGDEESQKLVNEEDIRASERERVYHDLALEQAEAMLDELEPSERDVAREYFDDIVEGKKLTPAKAKKYADMAISQATRNRKSEPKNIDKDQAIADKAGT